MTADLVETHDDDEGVTKDYNWTMYQWWVVSMQCVSGVGWEGHFSCFNPTDPTHSSHWSWPTKLTHRYRFSGHSSNQSSTVWHKKPGPAPHMTWWNWVLWPVSRTTTETCPVTWPETWYRYSTTPLSHWSWFDAFPGKWQLEYKQFWRQAMIREKLLKCESWSREWWSRNYIWLGED